MLMTLHDQQRETSLDKRRGHRPRLTAPGTGRRPLLTLADRLLATVLHQRLALPQVAIAALFGVRPETINKRIRDIRQLLEQAGYTIQIGPHRLASLEATVDWTSASNTIAIGWASGDCRFDPNCPLIEQNAGSAKPKTLRASNLPAGNYSLICDQPGHANLGMKGTLTAA